MLDLETLGTRNNAVILSIGAVEFDEDTIGSNFYTTLDIDDQLDNYGRTVQGNTILFWGEQSREVWNATVKAPVPAWDALLRFSNWMLAESCVWGNGSDFDNAILGSLYDAVKLPKPWKFSNNRCFRTLKNLGIKLKPGQGIEKSNAHNALADALYQARYAQWYLKNLKETQ